MTTVTNAHGDRCEIHVDPAGKTRPACAACLSELRRALAGRFDFAAWLERKNDWSARTFGPGDRTTALLAHIRKELDEIAADPGDVVEWVDLVFLATEGAFRVGHSPAAIIAAMQAKLARNEARTWPDWRTVPAGQPIEHVREEPTT